jgi:hypothetical protein
MKMNIALPFLTDYSSIGQTRATIAQENFLVGLYVWFKLLLPIFKR